MSRASSTPRTGAHLRRQIEAAFGRPLEELAAARDEEVVAFRRLLDPARAVLAENPFVAGPSPGYADCALFSLFQWARIVSRFELIEEKDPVFAWRSRMLALHGGAARAEPARSDRADPR